MSTIRESMIDLLEKTIKKNDYMSLVVLQMKIKNGFYESLGAEKAAGEIRYLKQYKKSYPHIGKELDEVIEYIDGIYKNTEYI